MSISMGSLGISASGLWLRVWLGTEEDGDVGSSFVASAEGKEMFKSLISGTVASSGGEAGGEVENGGEMEPGGVEEKSVSLCGSTAGI